MTAPLTFWRYYVPSKDGLSGWVDAVLRSDGFFAVVSDYGNYAYRWSCTGVPDFRKFFVGIDAWYARSKLDPCMEFDEDATREALQSRVLEKRRARRLNPTAAREAYDDAGEIYSEIDYSNWLNHWAGHFTGDDIYEDTYKARPPHAIRAFVEKALPRLQEMIRAEIQKESGAVCPG